METCVFAESSYFTTSLETKFMDDNLLIKKEQITNFEVIGKDIKESIPRDLLDYYSLSSQHNLFEVTKVVEGGYYSNTGSWVKSNNTFSTGLIEIDPTKAYKHNVFSYITYWDENEVFISGYIQGAMSVTNSINLAKAPENAKYVRFSVRIEDIPYIVVSESDVFSFELTNKYEDSGLIVKEENLDKVLSQKINSSSATIAGKTINFLGDSITYGFDGTNSTRVSKPYPTIVGEILGATVNNYGISGSTIGGDGKTSTEHNVLGNTPMNIRYVNMKDADYVLVFGGVNDYTVDRRIPLGQKGDATNLTFYGSLKILIDGLIAKYPNSRIGFITPLRKINDTKANVYGNHLKEYRNAIIEMCEEYSVPVLDLYTKGGCYANNSNWRAQNLPDGLHPNQAFYEKIAIQISSFIESI